MAAGRKPATKKSDARLTVVEDKGVIHIDTVVIKQNVKGTDYIPTPHGAVYSRLDEIEPGLHKVVKLSNGMLALNKAQRPDIMKFLTEQRDETGWSIKDLRDFYGV